MSKVLVFLLLMVFCALACELEELPATPVPTATATAASQRVSLGVGLADFENKFDGMTFEFHQLDDGTARWMASQDHIIVEVSGPRTALQKATVVLSTENVLAVMTLADAFLDVAVHGWVGGLDWMSDNMDRAIDRAVATSFRNKLIGMEFTFGGSLMLTVEAR